MKNNDPWRSRDCGRLRGAADIGLIFALGVGTFIGIFWITIPLMVGGMSSYYLWKKMAHAANPLKRAYQTTALVLLVWFIAIEIFWFKANPRIRM